jgi:CHASE2 domain-containing sensor protein
VNRRIVAAVYGGLAIFVVLFALGIASSRWRHPLERALACAVLIAVLIASPIFALYLAKKVESRG